MVLQLCTQAYTVSHQINEVCCCLHEQSTQLAHQDCKETSWAISIPIPTFSILILPIPMRRDCSQLFSSHQAVLMLSWSGLALTRSSNRACDYISCRRAVRTVHSSSQNMATNEALQSFESIRSCPNYSD